MADLSTIAALKAAIAAILNNSVPDESIEPDDHNGLLVDLLDTITGLDKVLRHNNQTGGYNLTITAGDLIKLADSGFFGDIDTATLTADRTYTFQDASGVVAFLSDLPTTLAASAITYNNTTSGLTATDVQAAIDEVEARVDVNDAKVSNVTTNLSEGTATTTTVDVNSSDGTNATLQPASTLRAGVMSKAKFDEVELNNAKVSNVTTDLSIGTKTASTVDINSSDGTNATVPSFTSTEAGLTPASGGGTTNFLRADGTWAAAGGTNIYTADGTISDVNGRKITFATGNSQGLIFQHQTVHADNRITFRNPSGGAASIIRQGQVNPLGGANDFNILGFEGVRISSGNGAVNSGMIDLWAGIVSLKPRVNIYNDNFTIAYHRLYNNTSDSFICNQTGTNLAIGHDTPAAKVHIKGAGATAGTRALYVENSISTNLFEIKDNGAIHTLGVQGFTGTGAYTNFTISNGIITAAS